MARHVDHLVIPVPDLAATAANFVGAGFVVTPAADHPFGTSNRLVVFVDTYLELVSVTSRELVPPEGFAAEVSSFLETGAGVSHVVLSSDDALDDHAVMAARGLAVGEVFEFSRPAPRVDGSTVTASFSIARSVSTVPTGAFLCQHLVPDAVWHASHLAHPNGARRLREIMLRGPAPEVFEVFAVDGIRFDAAQTRILTDGDHEPFAVGDLAVG